MVVVVRDELSPGREQPVQPPASPPPPFKIQVTFSAFRDSVPEFSHCSVWNALKTISHRPVDDPIYHEHFVVDEDEKFARGSLKLQA